MRKIVLRPRIFGNSYDRSSILPNDHRNTPDQNQLTEEKLDLTL